MTKIQLIYWPIRGLVEKLKLLCEYLGLEYELVSPDREKWFGSEKPDFQKKDPFANLPLLVDGDKVLGESEGIAVYLIHKAGKPELLGTTPEEKVQFAQFKGFFGDLYMKYISFCYNPNKDKLEEDKVQLKKDLAARLDKASAFLGKKEFLVGSFTYCDILMYDFLSLMFDLLFPDFAESHKQLKEYYDRVGKIERIHKYRSSERFQKEPCNGPSARFSPLKI